MKVCNFVPTNENKEAVANLFNETVAVRGFYKPFTVEGFIDHFFLNPSFDPEGAFAAYEGDLLVGFACGMIRRADLENIEAPGYFNCIFVKPEYQRRGIGSALIKEVENYFKRIGRKTIRCVFLNPVNWPWYIPNTDKHDHPGNPAIPFNSPEYFLLLANGYYVQGHQDAFHLALDKYEMAPEVVEKIAENVARGYKIEVYDPAIHYGLLEFIAKVRSVGNEGFAHAIESNLAKEKPNPFLVVSEKGRVVGWTGAMYTEPSGRAHFDGIIVDPDVRGGGLGKTLFCSLGDYSRIHGSKFMTFFTGLDNPARFIYMYAGFKIVQSFAAMKKELK